MTVIGNNSANNSNPLANISVTGAKGIDGSTGVNSFLDIISMLSSSAEALDTSSNTDLLVTQMESEAEPSTLALLQKFLDQEQIFVPLISEISSEDIFFLTILNLPTLRFTLLNSSVSNSFSSPGRLALTILAATSFSFKRDK